MLADAYLKRSDYADAAIDVMISIASAEKNNKFCDEVVGVSHLTLMLAARGLDLVAVEPNYAMCTNGLERTEKLINVRWHEETGQASGQVAQAFDIVPFGSSYNVCDRQQVPKEIARILKLRGWFACMWSNRRLEDQIQSQIEALLRYGWRDMAMASAAKIRRPLSMPAFFGSTCSFGLPCDA